MAPINPWLATLIETELENVIAWKSIVKPDPDADGEQRSRFSDDGSNLRSVVSAPQLDSDSTIQLLEVSTFNQIVYALFITDVFHRNQAQTLGLRSRFLTVKFQSWRFSATPHGMHTTKVWKRARRPGRVTCCFAKSSPL